MQIRCPHCRNSLEVVDDDRLQDLTCPSCGSSFNLLPDETVSRQNDGGRTLGRFELVDRLGVGSFGEVWTAHDSELDRIVAIKIPRKGQLTADEAEAFLREARSAARLNHPNIVAVHEVGKENDQLFIVSDYVRGLTLADWLTGKRPTPREAANLCAGMADAVQHAHENGVIHRDLKPSNIMLDGDGQPHIMDFGLAKREAGEITMTLEGKVLGTPAYMSPEQARGDAHAADQRSDIYSLGVILFELLTGELPFRGNARMLIHQVINEEPPAPRQLNNQVSSDLDTICRKCMEKEPRRRYQTAAELGHELRRVLRGEPILARPVTRLGRLWRWCKRKPVVSGLATAFTVAVALGLAGIIWQWIRAEGEAEQNRRLLYVSDMNVAMQAWDGANIERVEYLLKRYEPQSGKEELRGFDWYYLWRLCERARQANTIEQRGRVRSIAVSPRDDLLAVGYANGQVCLWNLKNEKVLRCFRQPRDIWRIEGEYEWERPCIGFSPDGATLAYPSQDYERIILHPLADGKERVLDGYGVKFLQVTFSPDGQFLATRSVDLSMKLWNLKSGTSWDIPARLEKPLSDHYAGTDYYTGSVGLAFDRNSKRLVTGNVDKSIVVWDIVSRKSIRTLRGYPGLGWTAAFSPDPDEELLAFGSRDGKVRLWDLKTGSVKVFEGHTDEVRSVAFAPNGEILASGSRDNTAILWDIATGSKIEWLKGHSHNVESLDFWQNGETLKLVTGSSDRTVKCWLIGQRKTDAIVVGTPVRELVLSPDGNTMASRQHGPRDVTLWSLQKDKALPLPVNVAGNSSSIAISMKNLAVGIRGEVQLWRFNGVMGKTLRAETNGDITALRFSPHDGEILAAGSEDGHVIAWNVTTGVRLFEASGHSGCVTAVSFTPRGDALVSASYDHTAMLWNPNTGGLLDTIPASKEHVMCAAFSRGGGILASGGYDDTVKLWRYEGGKASELICSLVGHSDGVISLAFPPDDRTVITACGDCMLKVWDIRTAQERLTLSGHAGAVECAALSSDGTLLVSGGRDGTIRFWRAATEQEVHVSGWYDQ